MSRHRHARPAAVPDPFAVLGLPPVPDLSDDDVRVAWRRIAAATHPDRSDGGDPARYRRAAAAYAVLRTGDGRGEALADRAPGGRHGSRGRRGPRGRHGGAVRNGRGRGRPGILAVRVIAAAAVCAAAFAAAGWAPASIGVLAGAATWLVATARHDLPAWRR